MNKCKYCGYTGTNEDMEKHAGKMCWERIYHHEIRECIEKNFHPYLPVENDVQSVEYDIKELTDGLYNLFERLLKFVNRG